MVISSRASSGANSNISEFTAPADACNQRLAVHASGLLLAHKHAPHIARPTRLCKLPTLLRPAPQLRGVFSGLRHLPVQGNGGLYPRAEVYLGLARALAEARPSTATAVTIPARPCANPNR